MPDQSSHRTPAHRARRAVLPLALVAAAGGAAIVLQPADAEPRNPALGPGIVVFAYNDLGMHCMNDDFSEAVILPPYNTVRAQVLKRGGEPDIITEEVTVSYSIPSNTHSADKTNFWNYTLPLFGVQLPPDVGLTGHGLSGTMDVAANHGFEVTGIPLTPFDDSGRTDPYPVALITAEDHDGNVAFTRTVVPVSQELTCTFCHNDPGVSMATDFLGDHDRLHGTNLLDQRPVLCAACHKDVALGAPGDPTLPSLSAAMHGAHASRMDMVDLDNDCYACHPGIRTKCWRDVHYSAGMTCTECHGSMEDLAAPTRQPWIDEPRCGSCHSRPGFQFEQPGKHFKDSVGHGGVQCCVCHGSPHAIGPTVSEVDDAGALLHQGAPAPISECTVCHTQTPGEPFFHSVEH